MGPVGDLGLLKMDFLGLKTLTVIRNTCEMVRAPRASTSRSIICRSTTPQTYDLLNKAQTLGVFQLESGGMRDLCRKFQIAVRRTHHRPGLALPARADGPHPGLHRAPHGRKPKSNTRIRCSNRSRETYGILIYQEQVMQAAQILAGYTLGGADLLRRAMGKKETRGNGPATRRFVQGCAEKNAIPAAKANQVFDLLEKFAGYGFNKSHAAAYAVVAYQTAYLKANYPSSSSAR
jgi:DNA polymerase III subunit alpha